MQRKNHRWTPDQDDYLRENWATKSAIEISEYFLENYTIMLSPHSVNGRVDKLKLTRTPDEVQTIQSRMGQRRFKERAEPSLMLGSIQDRPGPDGNVYRFILMGPNLWIPMQLFRLIAAGELIPHNAEIKFLDDDRLNTEVSNLRVVIPAPPEPKMPKEPARRGRPSSKNNPEAMQKALAAKLKREADQAQKREDRAITGVAVPRAVSTGPKTKCRQDRERRGVAATNSIDSSLSEKDANQNSTKRKKERLITSAVLDRKSQTQLKRAREGRGAFPTLNRDFSQMVSLQVDPKTKILIPKDADPTVELERYLANRRAQLRLKEDPAE